MKNILCYGDSNTFGTSHLQGDRYGRDVRWPGRLQQLLGQEYYVIEEGLNGRTTVFDDPFDNTKNGLMALPIILSSHKPLDLIVLMLGTNDLKAYYPTNPKVIARGIEKLVTTIRGFEFNQGGACDPEILIVSPILFGDIEKCPFSSFDDTAAAGAQALAQAYETIANIYQCHFFNAATVATYGADQVHMTEEGHTALADALHSEILGILK